jgi:pimeloyl-ACP methyl ester carboxylesterase
VPRDIIPRMLTPHTFILIHGAWHASWCFQPIKAALESSGHHVLTPDLPGHGIHTRPPASVRFENYVDAIIELIRQQPEPVMLVGHSMAGLIIAQVAERIPAHIKELIFLNAYIPTNNQSLLSLAETQSSKNLLPFLHTDTVKKEITLLKSPELISIFYNRCSHEDATFALKQLQPQPLEPFTAKVRIAQSFEKTPKRSIVCRDDRVLLLANQLNMSKVVTDNIICLDADHSPFYSAPSDLLNALLTPTF